MNFRPKKVVLFPEIGWVKNFLSPIRPHKSNRYEHICFLFQKSTHTNKQMFFPSKNKIGLCFATKKSAVRVVFSVRQQPTNCLSVFDHFGGLVLKGLSADKLKCSPDLTLI